MLFVTLDFVIFLAIVLTVYWTLRSTKAKNYFLLAASLFFYGYADWKFLSLIFTCTLVGYVAAIAIEEYRARAKTILALGVTVPFGILFVFKYFNFFVDSFHSFFQFMGIPFSKTTLSLALPLGISFFTFQTVGYIIDVYRERSRAERNFCDLFLFITFFPQLVAGPIERATHLLPEIKSKRTINQDDVLYGSYLVLQGFVKKMVIADNLAPIVNSIFSYPNLSGPLVLAGLVAFAFQIYGDFSGYTDIARGVARLMGFRILLNFNHPYMAVNPTDFWRRWHITLSNWFKDYLYIPLGGNRKGRARLYLNLMITWSICGLWHGASINFVLWGAFHGIVLVLHKAYSDAAEGLGIRNGRAYTYIARAATFALVLYGWLLFRITDVSQIWSYTVSLFADWSYVDVSLLALSQIAQFVSMMLAIDYFEGRFLKIEESEIAAGWRLSPYFAAMILIMVVFMPEAGGDFIYFRF